MGESRYWWVILLAGILMVICGFTYWFWPVAGLCRSLSDIRMAAYPCRSHTAVAVVRSSCRTRLGLVACRRYHRHVYRFYDGSQHRFVRGGLPLFPCIHIYILGHQRAVCFCTAERPTLLVATACQRHPAPADRILLHRGRLDSGYGYDKFPHLACVYLLGLSLSMLSYDMKPSR